MGGTRMEKKSIFIARTIGMSKQIFIFIHGQTRAQQSIQIRPYEYKFVVTAITYVHIAN